MRLRAPLRRLSKVAASHSSGHSNGKVRENPGGPEPQSLRASEPRLRRSTSLLSGLQHVQFEGKFRSCTSPHLLPKVFCTGISLNSALSHLGALRFDVRFALSPETNGSAGCRPVCCELFVQPSAFSQSRLCAELSKRAASGWRGLGKGGTSKALQLLWQLLLLGCYKGVDLIYLMLLLRGKRVA